MFIIEQSWERRFEVNCGPRLEVIVLGTPKQDIQEKVNIFAHATTDVSTRRIASIHFDMQSMTVKMCEQLLLDCNGPTKSMWIWEEWRCGMGIGKGWSRTWQWILPCWQQRQDRVHAVMSLDGPRQTNLEETRRWEASLSGWEMLCKFKKEQDSLLASLADKFCSETRKSRKQKFCIETRKNHY